MTQDCIFLKKGRSINDDCGLNSVECGPLNSITTAYQCHPDCASKEVFELQTLSALVSVLASRFLTAAFIVPVIYKYCVQPQLCELCAPFEKTLLWLGGAWFGALENYTLDHLPIRRLNPHDLQLQAGTVLTLLIIIAIIIAIAVGQLYYLRLEGRFR